MALAIPVALEIPVAPRFAAEAVGASSIPRAGKLRRGIIGELVEHQSSDFLW